MLAPLTARRGGSFLAPRAGCRSLTAVSPRARGPRLRDLRIRAVDPCHGRTLRQPPGTLGLLRLMRDVIAHLAVTGSIAVGDSLSSRSSARPGIHSCPARLGEGRDQRADDGRASGSRRWISAGDAVSCVQGPQHRDFLGDLAPRRRTVQERSADRRSIPRAACPLRKIRRSRSQAVTIR